MTSMLLLLLALTTDPATCPMHAQHAQHAQSDVDTRGDHVMGFSHEKTTHAFRLFDDGGAVEVRANDANDAESVAAIRAHLKDIAKEFAAGTFTKPEEIHARIPDGVPVMRALGEKVTYRYEELERGARIVMRTNDASGLEAVHQFLRFQIADHHTGDSGKVE